MRKNSKVEKNRISLLLGFWVNITILFLVSMYLLFHVGLNGKSISESDFTYERFGIIFTLILIPLSLKFYHNRSQKLLMGDKDKYLSKMPVYYYLRLMVIDFTIIFNLVCFYYINAMNFFYLALIGIFSFFVCYPNQFDHNIENKNETL